MHGNDQHNQVWSFRGSRWVSSQNMVINLFAFFLFCPESPESVNKLSMFFFPFSFFFFLFGLVVSGWRYSQDQDGTSLATLEVVCRQKEAEAERRVASRKSQVSNRKTQVVKGFPLSNYPFMRALRFGRMNSAGLAFQPDCCPAQRWSFQTAWGT